ncbi:MAG: glycosyltransferase family 2 protein [Candidatus Berkelbacteria bacterium]|nr:glycosyltransferase family 2 protein [Candidatus Berkelbacteria bacterium]
MTISILVPIYNGASTIEKTLDSLVKQSIKIDEIFLINDGSRDDSFKIISGFVKSKKLKNATIINHKKPIGLAASYNEGIKKSKSELIVTLHQDVIFKKNSLSKLIEPFEKDQPEIVAAYHNVLHPKEVWQKYNFWQKVFFSRLVGKKYSGLDGKFDCFRKSSLLKIGGFDQKNFRTAGEDGEIINRLKKIGRIVPSEAEIIHLHRDDKKFSLSDIIKKQCQYSEAQGVMLRLGVIQSPKQIVSAFFRELLLISLLVPYLRPLGIALIIVYAFYYTKLMFLAEYKNWRILLLPFLNVYLLFISLLFSIRGFIFGYQRV